MTESARTFATPLTSSECRARYSYPRYKVFISRDWDSTSCLAILHIVKLQGLKKKDLIKNYPKLTSQLPVWYHGGWQLYQMLFRDKAKIVPGIGTLQDFSGKHAIIPRHCRKKSGHRRKFYFMYPKTSGAGG